MLNSIEKWKIGEEKWTTIQCDGDTLKEKVFHKSVQVDEEFILIFGGSYENTNSEELYPGDVTSYKFYPGNNQVKEAGDMAN